MADPGSFGPYKVHEELGLGGMATVHRAELTGFEGFSRQVALKRMLPSLAINEEIVKSFVREARLASYLQHANCAQTYELGNIGGTYFIAMELIRGRSIQEIMDRCAAARISMPVPIALGIVTQILDALDYAHNLCDETGQPLGIIHRDVSPANVLIDAAGVVKLIDFGIAKASAIGMQTQSFAVKGKFAYMAPEYVTVGKIDLRADLFAAGVIAYELLTGKPLFSAADDVVTLGRLRELPIEAPSLVNGAIPFEIDSVVLTALGRDPAERWQQAAAMRSALNFETKRLGLEVVGTQIAQWLDDLFDDNRVQMAMQVPRIQTPMPTETTPSAGVGTFTPAAPRRPTPDPTRATGPAQWLDDTNLNKLIGASGKTPPPGSLRKAPRGATGAEPLWDLVDDLPRETPQLRALLATPAAGTSIVVTKKANPTVKRAMVITLTAVLLIAIGVVVLLVL